MMWLSARAKEDRPLSTIMPRFEEADIPLLEQAVTEFLVENWKLVSEETYRQLLDYILKRKSDGAISFAFTVLENSPSDEQEKIKRRHTGHLLMQYSARNAWDRIWGMIQQDSAFGRSFVEAMADDYPHDSERFVHDLDEENIADLFIWIEGQYPHEEDPDIEGFHAISTRENVAQWRYSLLKYLQSKGTVHASEEIARIRSNFPEWDYLNHVLYLTKQHTRRETWIPANVNDIVALAEITPSETNQRRAFVPMLIVACVVLLVVGLIGGSAYAFFSGNGTLASALFGALLAFATLIALWRDLRDIITDAFHGR
ncbi:MAG: hypothetical protein IH582_07620 [Afipia sp.]|nr:hypothetical protein [Afipia sp.]